MIEMLLLNLVLIWQVVMKMSVIGVLVLKLQSSEVWYQDMVVLSVLRLQV